MIEGDRSQKRDGHAGGAADAEADLDAPGIHPRRLAHDSAHDVQRRATLTGGFQRGATMIAPRSRSSANPQSSASSRPGPPSGTTSRRSACSAFACAHGREDAALTRAFGTIAATTLGAMRQATMADGSCPASHRKTSVPCAWSARSASSAGLGFVQPLQAAAQRNASRRVAARARFRRRASPGATAGTACKL